MPAQAQPAQASARWVHAPVSSAREDEKGEKKRRKGARDQVPGLCGIFLCASVPVVRALHVGWGADEPRALTVFAPKLLARGEGLRMGDGGRGGEVVWDPAEL